MSVCHWSVMLFRGSWGMVQDMAQRAEASAQREDSKTTPHPCANAPFPWAWSARSPPLVFCTLSSPLYGFHPLCSARLFLPLEFPWIGTLVYTTMLPSSLIFFTPTSHGFSYHAASRPRPLPCCIVSFPPVTAKESLTNFHCFPLTTWIFLPNHADAAFTTSYDDNSFSSPTLDLQAHLLLCCPAP